MVSPIRQVSHGKIHGASPAEDRFYVLIFYDISNAKKYRCLVKILNSYGVRVQKSVFEAQLKREQIKDLSAEVGKLMADGRFYSAGDSIRIYKIAGNCEATIFGLYCDTSMEDNLFF